MGPIWDLYGFIIDLDLLVADMDGVPRHTNDPFNKVLLGIFSELEHNDIPPFGVCDRDDREIQERDFHAVDNLVHKNVIPDEQGWLHGTGWYFEGLNYKSADEQGQNDGKEESLSIFPKDVLFWPHGRLRDSAFF